MTLYTADVLLLGVACGTLAMLLIVWAASPKGKALDTIGMTAFWAGCGWFVLIGVTVYMMVADGTVTAAAALTSFAACVIHLFVYGACYGISSLLKGQPSKKVKNGTTPTSS